MATVKFPKTPAEIKATGDKFFPKHKTLGAESPLRILPQHDFDKLGDTEYKQWLELNKQADELTEQARLLREKRDALWATKLKPPMLEAKKIIVSISSNTPTYASGWGFETVKKPSKRDKANDDSTTAQSASNNENAGAQ